MTRRTFNVQRATLRLTLLDGTVRHVNYVGSVSFWTDDPWVETASDKLNWDVHNRLMFRTTQGTVVPRSAVLEFTTAHVDYHEVTYAQKATRFLWFFKSYHWEQVRGLVCDPNMGSPGGSDE